MENWRDTSKWSFIAQREFVRLHRSLSQIQDRIPFVSSFSAPTYEKIEQTTDTGYRFFTHHWQPDPSQSLSKQPKNILLIPDWKKEGACFLDSTEILTGDELARDGWNVISIDFCGRGDSWGNEDWGGGEHQTQVAQQIDLCEGLLVVIAFGAGLNTAVKGSIQSKRDIDYFIDIEGIPNKEILLRLPQIPRESPKAIDYWNLRTCDDILSSFPYPYHRVQGEIDQNLPDDLRHARLVIRNAPEGHFRLNDHPKGVQPSRPRWIKLGKIGLHNYVLRLLTIIEKSHPFQSQP